EQPETPPNPRSTVSFRPCSDFVNRETLLTHIHNMLSVPASRVVLVGLDGPQLAIKYCHRAGEQLPETCALWVDASNTACFKRGHHNIVDIAKLPGRRDLKADIFQLVSSWLRDKSQEK
ncbi:hypothetical protein K469DRAFT_595502, partial [Zopfia rhizophila CBS 207.26]